MELPLRCRDYGLGTYSLTESIFLRCFLLGHVICKVIHLLHRLSNCLEILYHVALSSNFLQVEELTNQEEVELRSKIEALGLEVTKVPSKSMQQLDEVY